jgi:hypothetical protein
MVIGLLMILAPGVVFVLTLPLSNRLLPSLRTIYRFVGGIVVFLGSGISIYFASYGGDQGGIAAFFFQIAVIVVYAAFSIALVTLNWFLNTRASGESI